MEKSQIEKEVMTEVAGLVDRAKTLGISETKLAQKVGVTWMAIYRWKTGENVPSAAMLKTLQRVVEQEEAVFGD